MKYQATKRQMAINVLKALYLVKDFDETMFVWKRRINKIMKMRKSELIERNEIAIKVISDKLL
jgi:hypothetical protein